MANSPAEGAVAAGSGLAWRCAKGLVFLLFAGVCSLLASNYIGRAFPDRPTPRDFLFEVLPYVDIGQYLNDIAVFGAVFLLLGYAFFRAPKDLPDLLGMFGTMYLLRAAIMILTPLASAHGNDAHYGIVPLLNIEVIQNGMFPSGHTAAALLCFLLVDPKRAPRLRKLQLVLAFVTWITLILSHGHYSIDVVGGLLLSYFVWREWTIGSLLRPVKRFINA